MVKIPPAAAKALAQMEKKFLARKLDATTLATAWAGSEQSPPTFLGLTSMAQGDSTSERIGRKVVIESVRIKGDVRLTATSGTTLNDPVQVRIIVYQDKQVNNSQAAAEDVVDANPSDPVYAFANMFEITRFKILADRLINIVPQAGAGNGTANDTPEAVEIFKINLTKLNMPVNFTLGTGNIDAVMDNSIQVAAICSATGATIRYQARIYYYG